MTTKMLFVCAIVMLSIACKPTQSNESQVKSDSIQVGDTLTVLEDSLAVYSDTLDIDSIK